MEPELTLGASQEGPVSKGCFATHGVKTSIQLGAQAEERLGVLADYVLLVQPGCSLSLRWETWALQALL